MAVLTKHEALLQTYQIWDWLSENSDTSPNKYDAIRELGLSPGMEHNCPLCEYTNKECELCPMLDFWEGFGTASANFPCCCKESPYRLWEDGVDERFNARLISDGAKRLLKEVI